MRSWSITSTHRWASVSTTSSIDFLPKLGIALSSPSDFEIRSPTVWMPARLRQLYERTPSSSSSIRMSSIGERAACACAVLDTRQCGRAGAQFLDAVLVGEDRQRRDQDLRGLAQRG